MQPQVGRLFFNPIHQPFRPLLIWGQLPVIPGPRGSSFPFRTELQFLLPNMPLSFFSISSTCWFCFFAFKLRCVFKIFYFYLAFHIHYWKRRECPQSASQSRNPQRIHLMSSSTSWNGKAQIIRLWENVIFTYTVFGAYKILKCCPLNLPAILHSN